FGVRPADIVFFAFSYGTFVGFWGAHYACEKIGCLVLPGGNMTTEARVKQILSMKATVVCSTPTYALRMAQEAKTTGVDLAGSPGPGGLRRAGRAADHLLRPGNDPGVAISHPRSRRPRAGERLQLRAHLRSL